MLGRLDGDVQIAVRPFAEPAGSRRAALRPKRGPEFRDQLLPLPIRWRARKIDHSRHSDRHPEGSPHGRRPPASVEPLRGLRDSRRLDARLLTDALELIEGQPAGFGGQRPSRVPPVVARLKISRTSSSPYRRSVIAIDCTVAASHALPTHRALA